MKKGDVLWGIVLAGLILLFVLPASRTVILEISAVYPFLSGFVQFAILATMGDLMGKRIVTGIYQLSLQVAFGAILWGVIGVMITVVFPLYMGGAGLAQAAGLLPFFEVAIAQAFFGSAIMNLTFAPAMNTFHRVLDLLIQALAKNERNISLKQLLGQIDWPQFVSFNWLKVGCLFWIPVHTIVFLLPEDIRVVVAAFSSIALGIILSFAAKSHQSDKKMDLNAE